MADPIREALKRLLAVIKPKYTDPDEIVAVVRAMAAARAALSAEPSAPAPADHVPDAGNMVPAAYAARLRQCPTHGQLPANAWGCPECLRELREELARLRAPAADGEREELAQWLEGEARSCAAQFHDRITRAAALLRQPAPAPVLVPVAERPWERPGWCDAEGRCWWGRCADDFFSPEWTMATLASIEEFCSDAMPQHCLPHWAIVIPQPPEGGEVEA